MNKLIFFMRHLGLAFFLVCGTLYVISIDSVPWWISLIVGIILWLLLIFGDWKIEEAEIDSQRSEAVTEHIVKQARTNVIFDQDDYKGEYKG